MDERDADAHAGTAAGGRPARRRTLRGVVSVGLVLVVALAVGAGAVLHRAPALYVVVALVVAVAVGLLVALLLGRARRWVGTGAAVVVAGALLLVPVHAAGARGGGVVWSVDQGAGSVNPVDVAAVGDAYLLVGNYGLDVVDAASGQRRGGLAFAGRVRRVAPVGPDGVLVSGDDSVAYFRIGAGEDWDVDSPQPAWDATTLCGDGGTVEPVAAADDLVVYLDSGSCGGTLVARDAAGRVVWQRDGFARGLPALAGAYDGRSGGKLVEPLPSVVYALSRDASETVTLDARTGDVLGRTPDKTRLKAASDDVALWDEEPDDDGRCTTSASRSGEVLWTRSMPCLWSTAWVGGRYWGFYDRFSSDDQAVAPSMLDIRTGEIAELPRGSQYASTSGVVLSGTSPLRASTPPSTETAWTWSKHGIDWFWAQVESGPGAVAVRSTAVGYDPFVGAAVRQVTVLDPAEGSTVAWYRDKGLEIVGTPGDGRVVVHAGDRLTLLEPAG